MTVVAGLVAAIYGFILAQNVDARHKATPDSLASLE